jgi:metal-sulfur cluster biosynthetic enzyme
MSAVALTSAERVEARIWDALRHVEDPEIPVSVLGLGLIVSVAYAPDDRTAELQITFTAMGCPATEFIEQDIREALLADPEIDAVEIEVVWDPVWTKDRIRDDARCLRARRTRSRCTTSGRSPSQTRSWRSSAPARSTTSSPGSR